MGFKRSCVIGLVIAGFSLPLPARSQTFDVVAQACSQGICGDIEPASALIILALAQIAQELSKDDPFGKNNEIVKSVTTMINDLKHGPGPNNDLIKILNSIGSDLRCGPGPNNDVIKFLGNLGIKITTKSC